MDQDVPVGHRIAHWRRKRGITQEALAGLVGRSESWLKKIESGKRTVEAVKDVLLLARALGIESGELIRGIELEPNGDGPLDPPQGIHTIRRAVLLERTMDREPPDIAEVRADLEDADRFIGNGFYKALAVRLPDLIVSARSATVQDAPEGWSCLARAFRAASSLARNVGERELAWITADRAIGAAQRSGDRILVASCVRTLGSALMAQGWLDEAGAVCSDAADALAPTDDTPPEGWALWGSLHLSQAIIAVRGGDGAYAWQTLRAARAAAKRVGEGRNDYYEAFGPANVGAHEITVALEDGNAVEALRAADRVEVEKLPYAERRVRVLVDVAAAHGLRRNDAATVAVLLEAERHSPEVLRHQVLAHELVRVCLGRERKSRTPGLRGLAERLGVTG